MHNHNFSSRSIVIGCNTVEWVNTYKRLVVIISDDLRWVHHNEYISKKASKHLYSLRILERVGVASDSILRVCLTIFRPILEYGVIYCNEVDKRSLFIYLFSRGAIPLELVYTRQMSVCSATSYEAIDNSTKQLGLLLPSCRLAAKQNLHGLGDRMKTWKIQGVIATHWKLCLDRKKPPKSCRMDVWGFWPFSLPFLYCGDFRSEPRGISFVKAAPLHQKSTNNTHIEQETNPDPPTRTKP